MAKKPAAKKPEPEIEIEEVEPEVKEVIQVKAEPLSVDRVQELREPGGVTRRKVNRGSTRRINRALTNVLKALHDFRDEIDRQVFVTDEDGNRTGPVDLVTAIDAQRKELPGIVASFTTPG